MIVDAVNTTADLAIEFPDYTKQHQIAARNKQKSQAGFDGVVGFIDGILIWTEQPSPTDCETAGVGPKKFYCGCKKKFGLVMTGVVDDQRRFIDVDISHPGATSDYLAFSVSSLKDKLENKALLLEDHYLFGDNAYVNTEYMVTPYPNATGNRDDYNFYHSQLRITVECAFGMLVQRWSILRSPLSLTMGISKVTALVMCLCRLHNFLINDRLEESLVSNRVNGVINGGYVAMQPHPTFRDESVPEEILYGGKHFDDVGELHIRRERARARNDRTLPRQLLFESVCDQGLKRPDPAR